MHYVGMVLLLVSDLRPSIELKFYIVALSGMKCVSFTFDVLNIQHPIKQYNLGFPRINREISHTYPCNASPVQGKQKESRTGRSEILKPWLPSQLYAVSDCLLKSLGNWKGEAGVLDPQTGKPAIASVTQPLFFILRQIF